MLPCPSLFLRCRLMFFLLPGGAGGTRHHHHSKRKRENKCALSRRNSPSPPPPRKALPTCFSFAVFSMLCKRKNKQRGRSTWETANRSHNTHYTYSSVPHTHTIHPHIVYTHYTWASHRHTHTLHFGITHYKHTRQTYYT